MAERPKIDNDVRCIRIVGTDAVLDEDVSRLIGRIYADAGSDEGFSAIVEEVVTRTGSRTAVVASVEPSGTSLGIARWYGSMGTREAAGLDAALSLDCADPTLLHLAARPCARHFDTTLDRNRSVHEADPYIRYHRHYFRGTHWTLAHVGTFPHESFGISLHHGEPGEAHSDGQRRLFRMLFDHVARARALLAAPAVPAIAEEAVAVIHGNGCVARASAAAGKLLAAGDGIMLVDGRVTAEAPHQRRAFNRLLADALTAVEQGAVGGAIALECGSGGQPLVALVDPAPLLGGLGMFHRAALLRVVERAAPPPANAPDRWRLLWELTPAEARVAATLVAGSFDLRAAADRLGVTYPTVRSQLASILAKTGCRGQPELMRLLTRIPG